MENKKPGVEKHNRWGLGAAGILAGFINGLLGSGGGVLIVLYLSIMEKSEQKNAQATAIAVILPLTILSSIIYALNGHIAWSPLWKVSIGGVGGAVLGAFLLNRMKSDCLKRIFGVFLIIAGIRMLFF